MSDPTFTPDQADAFAAVKAGHSICITGPAGTGKSYLLDKIRAAYGPTLAVTATTGIAALNVSGTTIHSWAGLGLGDRSAKDIAGSIIGKGGKVRDRIRACRRLAIDEISMMPAPLLTKLDEVLQFVRKNRAPFGGVQMIFLGDFLQLPPVSREDDYVPFAFQSAAWIATGVKVHQLRTVVRQKDADFARVLNKIRIGDVDHEVMAVLESRVCAIDPNPTTKPVKLYGTNAAVDGLNAGELSKIPGPTTSYECTDTGIPMFVEQLRKNCIAPQRLDLKVGAQVMLLKNLAPELGLVNGALGRVLRFEGGWPVVEFAGGTKWHGEPASWELKDGEEILASRSQVPLRLAWAITIHKSQGMTLDKLEADLFNIFTDGQAYVAVSRAKSLEGLFLSGLNLQRITADPSALAFYGYPIPTF